MRHKSRKPQPILENVRIEEPAAEGKFLNRHEGMVIFTEYTAPGDIVDMRIHKTKKNFGEATVLKFHSYSPERQETFCEHFGICGGCKLQHIRYDHQLKYKAKQVKDNLERIGKIALPEIKPIMPSATQTYYRNKLEYTFSNKRWLTREEIDTTGNINRDSLGFHVPGLFDKVVDVNHCYLQPDPSNAIRLEVKKYALENKLEFFDLRVQKGLLRILMLRTSASTGDLMVLFQFFRNDEEDIQKLLEHIKNTFPQITSLMYVINSKGNDTLQDLEIKTYHGKPYIEEKMEGLTFRIGARSFYQTNSDQAYELYKVARDMAKLTGEEVVYDLYTGTGTIANFVAKKAKKVIGVEYVEQAIEDAKVNSQINAIDNTSFYAGDMKDVLNDAFIAKNSSPDVIITDPPRAGMHPEVVDMLLRIAAKRIVYVSCNPATQARDLALLDSKYEVKEIQPVDMFPHTHHVEVVTMLELK